MKTSTVALLLATMILHSQALLELENQEIIQNTCNNTPHVQLCVATLRSAADLTVTGLSLTMVAAVKAKTKLALSVINKLMQSRHPYLTPALQKCTNVYKAVIKADVTVAMEALTKGNPKFAENGMADTVWEADICEGSFGRFGLKSPMTDVNKDVHDLAEIARAVIRNLL